MANLAGSARWPGLTGIGQTRESAPPRRVGAEAAASATAPGIDDPVPDQALPTASLADPCADASAAAIAWPPATPVLPGQGTIGSLPGEPLPSGVTAAVATDSRVAGPGNPVLQLAAASLAAPGPAGARRVAGAEASGRSVPASIQAGAGQPDKPAGPSAPVGMAAGPIRADSQPLAPALQGSPQGAAFGTAAADSKPAAAPVLPLAAEAPSRHSNTQSMPPVGTETPAGAVQALQMSPQPVGVAPSPLTTEVQAPGDKAAEPLTAVTPVPSQAGTLSSTGLAGGAAVKALPEASISVPVHESGFGAALGAQVSLLARGGLHEARLQLNPAEMGPITVQIALEGATARVHFQADLLATREVIEASLPALASSLRESGLTLTGGGVSQQGPQADQQQSGRQAQSQAQGQAAASGRQAAGAGDDGLGPLAAARALTRSRGLVDLVA